MFVSTGLGIKQPTRVDMPLNQMTEPNQQFSLELWVNSKADWAL